VSRVVVKVDALADPRLAAVPKKYTGSLRHMSASPIPTIINGLGGL